MARFNTQTYLIAFSGLGPCVCACTSTCRDQSRAFPLSLACHGVAGPEISRLTTRQRQVPTLSGTQVIGWTVQGAPENCCVTSVSAFAACSLVFGCVDSGLRGVHNLVKGYPCPARDLLPRKINSGCPACLQQLTSVDSFRRHDLLTLCLRTDVFTSLGFSFLICKTG